MKRLVISLFLVITAFSTVFAGDNPKNDPRRMTFPALVYQIPQAERVVLDCGIPVFLLRDTELPIINLTAMIRTGSVYDPADKSGLAGLTGSVMRSGGAGGTTAEKIDEELEFMASSVESSIGRDMGSVALSTLSRNFGRTLKIFSDVLLHPDFSQQRVEIARKQMIEGLRRQNDDPKEVAGRELAKVLYKGHPLGAVPTFASAQSITRQDMIDFHRRFFRVDNVILAVSGDFERDDMIRQLNAIFGKPEKQEALKLPLIPQPESVFSQELLYGRKEASQSVIRMGHMGITKDNPDIYAVRMLDYILGGSFTSRLMMEVRTNQGLAYNVGSHFDIGRRFTGSFVAETETKAETTAKVISLMKEIIAGMTKEEVTDQELSAARESIINSFMFGFTSPSAIVTQRARLEFYNYPSDYLEKYRDNIAKVSKADILNAAKKYLKPEQFKIVVVGDAAKFDKLLTMFGKVEILDVNQAAAGR